MTKDKDWLDGAIGGLFLFLPFLILWLMFSLWPLPGGSTFASWQEATRDVVVLARQEKIDRATLDTATAEQNKSDGATDQIAQARAKAVTATTTARDATTAKLADAKARQDKAYEAIVADGGAATMSDEARLCFLVVLAGALGASISAARGFAFHFGGKDYDPAWRWWYLLRIPTGCGIAFVSYAVLRAGLVPWKLDEASSALDHVNPYGFVAIGALGGMFANEAFQKLNAVLATILSSVATPTSDAKPQITNVSLTKGRDRKGITVVGKNFSKGASLTVEKQVWAVDASSITPTKLTATGDTDIPSPPATVDVKLTIPGPPPQTGIWNGEIQ